MPDLAYGVDGLTHTFLGYFSWGQRNIAFDPQGRVILGGTKYNDPYPSDVYAARYTVDGQADSTFGLNGVAHGVFCVDDDVVGGMAIGADASVFVAGHTQVDGTDEFEGVVLKWDSTGQVDTGFGLGQGTYFFTLGERAVVSGIAVQPDGKIIVCGYYDDDAGTLLSPTYPFLHRINPNGTPDTTFGVAGVVVPTLPGNDQWFGQVVLQADGRILATTWHSGVSSLMRFMPDGTLDTSFANNGEFEMGNYGDVYRTGLFVLPDERITWFLFIGGGFVGSSSYHRLARLFPDGTPDPSLGGDGVIDILSQSVYGYHAAMMGDGRMLLSPATFNSTGAACLNADGTLDGDFGIGGVAAPVATVYGAAGAVAVGPDQRFAIAQEVVSDVPNAQEPDIAVTMFTADSLWNIIMHMPQVNGAPLAMHPVPYAGGALTIIPDHAITNSTLYVYDAQARVASTANLGATAARTAIDIGPYVNALPNALYTLVLREHDGQQMRSKLLIAR